MVTSRLISGKGVSAKQLRRLIFRQQLLAMAEEVAWAARNMVASVKGFAWNTVIFKALLAISFAGLFLLPWLLLALAYMLQAFVVVTGWEPSFGNKNKAIR